MAKEACLCGAGVLSPRVCGGTVECSFDDTFRLSSSLRCTAWRHLDLDLDLVDSFSPFARAGREGRYQLPSRRVVVFSIVWRALPMKKHRVWVSRSSTTRRECLLFCPCRQAWMRAGRLSCVGVYGSLSLSGSFGPRRKGAKPACRPWVL